MKPQILFLSYAPDQKCGTDRRTCNYNHIPRPLDRPRSTFLLIKMIKVIFKNMPVLSIKVTIILFNLFKFNSLTFEVNVILMSRSDFICSPLRHCVKWVILSQGQIRLVYFKILSKKSTHL